jgi:hypothetical protein
MSSVAPLASHGRNPGWVPTLLHLQIDYRTTLSNALVTAAHMVLSNLYITRLDVQLNITNENCRIRTTHGKDDRERVYIITSVPRSYEHHWARHD